MVKMKKSVSMEAVKSLLLEWDGDGSGLEAVETAGGTLYKVADVIVQNEDIPGMTVTDNEGKETLVTDSIYNDLISRSLVGDGFAAKVAGYVYLAQKAAQAPGAELPAGGIWLLKKQDGSYPKKVVLPAYREAFLQGEKPDGEKGESMGVGATSWNDLTDKPFYEESGLVEVLPETSPAYDAENGEFMMMGAVGLVDGKTYIVNWNGTKYTCVATDASALTGAPAGSDVIMGNAGAMFPDFPVTEDPFIFMDVAAEGAWHVRPLDGTTELTISIVQDASVIHPIAPKFLPNPSDLSAEWIAALKTALGM